MLWYTEYIPRINYIHEIKLEIYLLDFTFDQICRYKSEERDIFSLFYINDYYISV